MEKTITTIQVNKELRQAIRLQAVKEQRTMGAVIEEALKGYQKSLTK